MAYRYGGYRSQILKIDSKIYEMDYLGLEYNKTLI